MHYFIQDEEEALFSLIENDLVALSLYVNVCNECN